LLHEKVSYRIFFYQHIGAACRKYDAVTCTYGWARSSVQHIVGDGSALLVIVIQAVGIVVFYGTVGNVVHRISCGAGNRIEIKAEITAGQRATVPKVVAAIRAARRVGGSGSAHAHTAGSTTRPCRVGVDGASVKAVVVGAVHQVHTKAGST